MKNFEIKDIGLRIKQLRKVKSLTQKDLGLITKTSTSRISEYENGNGCPNAEFLAAIIDCYPEIDLYWLLFSDNYKHSRGIKEGHADYSENRRKERIIQFIDVFFDDASEDEQVWLEMQLKFNLPNYRDFLEKYDE